MLTRGPACPLWQARWVPGAVGLVPDLGPRPLDHSASLQAETSLRPGWLLQGPEPVFPDGLVRERVSLRLQRGTTQEAGCVRITDLDSDVPPALASGWPWRSCRRRTLIGP